MKRIFRAVPVFVWAFALGGCQIPLHQSLRLDRSIAVDGDPSDWPVPSAKEAKQKILVRTFDGGGVLYVSLIVRDPAYARSILEGGLTTWLDPQGGKEKALGIVFPEGMKALGYKKTDIQRKLNNPQALADLLQIMSEDLETIGAKGEARKWSDEDLQARGFSAQMSFANDTFVYEMKIPMESADAGICSITPGPRSVIGIGLEAAGWPDPPSSDAVAAPKPDEDAVDAGLPTGGDMRGHGGGRRGMGGKGTETTSRSRNGMPG